MSSFPSLRSMAAWSIVQPNTSRVLYKDLNLNVKVAEEVREYIEIFRRYVSPIKLGQFEMDPLFFSNNENLFAFDFPEILEEFESDPYFLSEENQHFHDNLFLDILKNAFLRGRLTREKVLLKLLFMTAKKGFSLSIKCILEEAIYRGFDIVDDKGFDIRDEMTVNMFPEGRPETPLMIAARKGKLTALEVLVNHGANVNNDKTIGKSTPLLHAIKNKQKEEVIKKLIELGANVDHQDLLGRTALFWATYHGLTKIIKVLIDAGADIKLQNNVGITALSVAAIMNHVEAINALKEAYEESTEADAELIKANALIGKEFLINMLGMFD